MLNLSPWHFTLLVQCPVCTFCFHVCFFLHAFNPYKELITGLNFQTGHTTTVSRQICKIGWEAAQAPVWCSPGPVRPRHRAPAAWCARRAGKVPRWSGSVEAQPSCSAPPAARHGWTTLLSGIRAVLYDMRPGEGEESSVYTNAAGSLRVMRELKWARHISIT